MPEEIRSAEVQNAQNNPNIMSSLVGAPSQTTMQPQQQAQNIASDMSSNLYGSGFVSGGEAQADAATKQLFQADQMFEKSYSGASPYPTVPWYANTPSDTSGAYGALAQGMGSVAGQSIGAISDTERQYQTSITSVLSKLTDFLNLQEQRKQREEDRLWREKEAEEDKRRWEEEMGLKRSSLRQGSTTETERALQDAIVYLQKDIDNGVPFHELIRRYKNIPEWTIRDKYNAGPMAKQYGPAKETSEEVNRMINDLAGGDGMTAYQQFQAMQALKEEEEAKNKTMAQKQETTDLVDEVLNSDLGPVTGILRIGGSIPGTEAYTTKQKLEQIKKQLAVDARQKMKGSGQISDYESRMLEDSVAALNVKQSEDAIRVELNKIKDILMGKYSGQGGESWVDTGRVEER